MLRFSGKEYDNHWLVRLLVKPGLWLQKLTTAEPTDDMLEVAIASIKRVTEDPIAPVQQAMPVEEMS